MGFVSRGLLLYGLPFKDYDDAIEWDEQTEDVEWPVKELAARGVTNPWVAAGSPDFTPWFAVPVNHAAQVEYWGLRDQVKAEFGCDITYIGHHESAAPMVHVVAAELDAAWADTKPVVLATDPEWDGMLRRFAEVVELDLSLVDGPGWFLSSSYG